MSSFNMSNTQEGIDALRDLLRRVDGGEVQLSNVSIAVDNDMQDFRTIDGRIAQSVLRGQTITYSIVAMLMPAATLPQVVTSDDGITWQATPPKVYTTPRIRDIKKRDDGNFDALAYAQNEYQRPPRPRETRGGFAGPPPARPDAVYTDVNGDSYDLNGNKLPPGVYGRATGEGVVLPRPKVPRKPKEPTPAPVLGVPVRKIDI